ncbi:MAG TPA: Ni/Fe-hydrogenase, b-type cytochrome subunit [Desulfuromonadales bacterium]|nr:Ni/Fe-hydrogenase, b-type cytochrome subunit [Desulfuromonadales bacterium]
MLEIRYVWEWPVRITHWVNVLAIAVLSVTGFYIGHPFYTATDTAQYIMGWNRFIHFTFAYLFTVSIIARLIWAFLGNRHASWKAFFPWASKEGRRNIAGTFKYYTFLQRQVPSVLGHNGLAAMAYSAVFALFLLQVLTGFGLYSLYAPDGAMAASFGWVVSLLGLQGGRLIHHLIMWLLLGFAVHHVYSAWLMDVKEKNGTLSSIFGGYKFVEPEDLN